MSNMCNVYSVLHVAMYMEHLILLRQCILWIIVRYDYLRYDYLGNLWYGIIALNGIFIKKISFFETASVWPANMMRCSDCP